MILQESAEGVKRNSYCVEDLPSPEVDQKQCGFIGGKLAENDHARAVWVIMEEEKSICSQMACVVRLYGFAGEWPDVD